MKRICFVSSILAMTVVLGGCVQQANVASDSVSSGVIKSQTKTVAQTPAISSQSVVENIPDDYQIQAVLKVKEPYKVVYYGNKPTILSKHYNVAGKDKICAFVIDSSSAVENAKDVELIKNEAQRYGFVAEDVSKDFFAHLTARVGVHHEMNAERPLGIVVGSGDQLLAGGPMSFANVQEYFDYGLATGFDSIEFGSRGVEVIRSPNGFSLSLKAKKDATVVVNGKIYLPNGKFEHKNASMGVNRDSVPMSPFLSGESARTVLDMKGGGVYNINLPLEYEKEKAYGGVGFVLTLP